MRLRGERVFYILTRIITGFPIREGVAIQLWMGGEPAEPQWWPAGGKRKQEAKMDSCCLLPWVFECRLSLNRVCLSPHLPTYYKLCTSIMITRGFPLNKTRYPEGICSILLNFSVQCALWPLFPPPQHTSGR